jgi:hypothetical protein
MTLTATHWQYEHNTEAALPTTALANFTLMWMAAGGLKIIVSLNTKNMHL